MSDVKGIEADLAVSDEVRLRDAKIADLLEVIEELRGHRNELAAVLSGEREDHGKTKAALDALQAQMDAIQRPVPDKIEVPKGTPAEIRLVAPHGFIDDDGRNRHWNVGEVISNPREIALLIERGAAHVVTKEAPPEAPAAA